MLNSTDIHTAQASQREDSAEGLEGVEQERRAGAVEDL